jgi:hypothetical protein
VGSFTLAAEMNKSEAATGDAVSLRVRLAGKGNLKEIPDIPLPAMPDLTIYSSKREDNVHPVDGDQIGGQKIWDYVLVPKAPGDHTVPALSFSYFDPEHQAYETASTSPIPLKATRGPDVAGTVAGLSGIQKQALTRQGTDINFIKLAGPALEAREQAFYRSPWFYGFGLLPFAFNVGAFLYQRRRSRQSRDVVLTRSRKARGLAMSRLRRAEKGGRLEPRRFYDDAAAALAGYLEDKFNLPGIAVTGDGLELTMREKSIPETVVRETKAALQECDFGRFVSASSVLERHKELAARIRKIVDTLERQK